MFTVCQFLQHNSITAHISYIHNIYIYNIDHINTTRPRPFHNSRPAHWTLNGLKKRCLPSCYSNAAIEVNLPHQATSAVNKLQSLVIASGWSPCLTLRWVPQEPEGWFFLVLLGCLLHGAYGASIESFTDLNGKSHDAMVFLIAIT